MATQRTIIGIDPGQAGGIAVLEPGGGLDAWKMPPTERDLVNLLEREIYRVEGDTRKLQVFIEKVHSSPQMGVVSAFKFGRMLGNVHMACVALELPMDWVTPRKWQQKLGLQVSGKGLGQGDTAKKNRNKAKAQELFPGLKITHAIADALLIAEYGRRVTITEASDESE